jgi:hypothetical protein
VTALATGGILPTGLAQVGEDGCTLVLPPTDRHQVLGITINAAALTDPRNHEVLMAALRREARIQSVPLHELGQP